MLRNLLNYNIKTTLAIFLGLLCIRATSQPYINKGLDFNAFSEDHLTSFASTELTDGSFLISTDWFSSFNRQRITVLNKYGEITSGFEIMDSIHAYRFRSIINPDDGSVFFAGGMEHDQTGDEFTYASRYKVNGELIWDSVYLNTSSDFDICKQMIQTTNGDLALAGFFIDTTVWTIRPRLLLLDTLGNVILDSAYEGLGNSLSSAILSIVEDPGIGFLLAGKSNGQLYVLKTDYTGNVLWDSVYFPSIVATEANKIIRSVDGNFILVGGKYQDSVLGQQGIILKMNGLGSILWKKEIVGTGFIDQFYDVAELEDSTIIIVGDRVKSVVENDYKGWVVKTNNRGEVLWSRVITPDSNVKTSDHLFNLTILENKDILATGRTDNGEERPWLLRLDPCGCDSVICFFQNKEECNRGIGINEKIDLSNRLTIYPNPSSQIVHITLPQNDYKGSIRLISSTGSIIKNSSTTKPFHTLNVANLPKGIYLVEYSGIARLVERIVVR